MYNIIIDRLKEQKVVSNFQQLLKEILSTQLPNTLYLLQLLITKLIPAQKQFVFQKTYPVLFKAFSAGYRTQVKKILDLLSSIIGLQGFVNKFRKIAQQKDKLIYELQILEFVCQKYFWKLKTSGKNLFVKLGRNLIEYLQEGDLIKNKSIELLKLLKRKELFLINEYKNYLTSQEVQRYRTYIKQQVQLDQLLQQCIKINLKEQEHDIQESNITKTFDAKLFPKIKNLYFGFIQQNILDATLEKQYQKRSQGIQKLEQICIANLKYLQTFIPTFYKYLLHLIAKQETLNLIKLFHIHSTILQLNQIYNRIPITHSYQLIIPKLKNTQPNIRNSARAFLIKLQRHTEPSLLLKQLHQVFYNLQSTQISNQQQYLEFSIYKLALMQLSTFVLVENVAKRKESLTLLATHIIDDISYINGSKKQVLKQTSVICLVTIVHYYEVYSYIYQNLQKELYETILDAEVKKKYYEITEYRMQLYDQIPKEVQVTNYYDLIESRSKREQQKKNQLKYERWRNNMI